MSHTTIKTLWKGLLKSLLRFPQSYWIDLQYGEDLEVRTESKEDLTEIGEGGEDDWLTDWLGVCVCEIVIKDPAQ